MKPKMRGNGQGTAYKRGRTWTAQVVIGWKPSADGSHMNPVYRRKGGFPTKAQAIAACPSLMTASGQKSRLTLRDLYDAWEPFYSPRVGASTMVCYLSAYKHFSALHDTFVDLITAADLQRCMDACPSGKRTHENMRCVARLLWAYAMDLQIIDRDVTENLYIGRGKSVQRDPITEEELETIRQSIGRVRYADYVYALCYLGFRPGEFLSLKHSSVILRDGLMLLIGGSKTDAGTDRTVPVPPHIVPIIHAQLALPSVYLFPRSCGSGWVQMSTAYFREQVFKPMMKSLGLPEGKLPYSARHTYSDKLKTAAGDDKTKAALMGHTDYAFTQSHYQSISTDDLRVIAESIT